MLLSSGGEQLPGTTELHRQGSGADQDVVVLLLGDQLSHFSAASHLADHIKRWVVRQPAERFKPAEQEVWRSLRHVFPWCSYRGLRALC